MPIEIPLDVPGLKGAVDQLRELRSEARDARREVQGLGTDMRSAGRETSRLASRDRGERSGAAPGNGIRYATNLDSERLDRAELDRHLGRMANGSTQARGVATPEAVEERARRTANNGPRSRVFQWQEGSAQRHARDLEFLRNAEASGDDGAIFDARVRAKRSERAIERDRKLLNDTPPSRQDLLWDALQTSRIGPTGQLFPLVNKLRKAGLSSPEELSEQFGISTAQAQKLGPVIAAAAKVALPLMAGATAAFAAYRFTEGGAERLRVASDAYWAGGGSPDATGRMMSVGGSAAGAKAVALGDALRSSTYGAAYMRGRGILDLGSITVDKAGNYNRAIEELRRIKSDREAIRVARDLGLSEDLWLRDLPQGDFEGLRDSLGPMGSPSERRAEARYRAGKDRLGNYADWAWRTSATPLVDAGAKTISGSLGERVSSLMELARQVSNPGGYFTEQVARRKAAEAAEREKARKEAVSAPSTTTRPLAQTPELIGGGAGANRVADAMASPGFQWALQQKKLDKMTVSLGGIGI